LGGAWRRRPLSVATVAVFVTTVAGLVDGAGENAPISVVAVTSAVARGRTVAVTIGERQVQAQREGAEPTSAFEFGGRARVERSPGQSGGAQPEGQER